MRILVGEDEARIAAGGETALRASGYAVDVVGDGEEAWFRGDTEDYDAVVLDLGLPKLDGLTLLKRWRAAGRAMPILVLTARGLADWVEGTTPAPTTTCRSRSRWTSSSPGCGRSSAGPPAGPAGARRRAAARHAPDAVTLGASGVAVAARVPPHRLSHASRRARRPRIRARRAPLRPRPRPRSQRHRGDRRAPPQARTDVIGRAAASATSSPSPDEAWLHPPPPAVAEPSPWWRRSRSPAPASPGCSSAMSSGGSRSSSPISTSSSPASAPMRRRLRRDRAARRSALLGSPLRPRWQVIDPGGRTIRSRSPWTRPSPCRPTTRPTAPSISTRSTVSTASSTRPSGACATPFGDAFASPSPSPTATSSRPPATSPSTSHRRSPSSPRC